MVALGSLRVDQLKKSGFQNAALYNPKGVGGTSVVTVLAHGDHPDWYGLPSDPHVPLGVKFWKKILRPLGLITIAAAVFAAVGHYLNFGAKEVKGSADSQTNLPQA
jgi:hypothetical protein